MQKQKGLSKQIARILFMRQPLLFLIGISLFLSSAVFSDDLGAGSNIFSQGHTRLSIGGGYGSFHDRDYGIVDVGAGYYILDGLEAGLDGEAWLGSKPHIYSASPQLTYVLPLEFQWKPYVGGFYRRTFYDSHYKDINSVGGRAGAVGAINEHLYATAGLVYEKLFKCDSTLYTSCSQVYPELGLAFSY